MPRSTSRGPIRATAVLVRRYLPTALAVAGVVALLELTPTLDNAHGAPIRDAPAPSPVVTATTTTTTAPTSRTGVPVSTTTVVATTTSRPA